MEKQLIPSLLVKAWIQRYNLMLHVQYRFGIALSQRIAAINRDFNG